MQIDTRRVGVHRALPGGTKADQSLPCTGFSDDPGKLQVEARPLVDGSARK